VSVVRDIIKKVRSTISKYGMLDPGERVVVAVSGGPDSACLLDILSLIRNDLKIELLVAHFDHGLRPGDSEAEARFVEGLAESLNLPFEIKCAGKGILQGESSLEERARNARYLFLEEVSQKLSATKIALGHNLNDQAETVLMRLLRGSGLSGLGGIPPCRDGKIIRPLIEVTRGGVESYLEERGLKYMVDTSNLERRFLRNRIRHELLPQLEQYQPMILERLVQMAELMRSEDAFLETRAGEWVKRSSEGGARGEIQIPLSSFLGLHDALKNRVIRNILKTTGGTLRRISLRHIHAIKRMALETRPQAQIHLPNQVIARRIYDTLSFGRVKENEAYGFCFSLKGPGSYHLDALGCTVSLVERERGDVICHEGSPWVALINRDCVNYPLVLRNYSPGDRFKPFGMQGRKKLKDFFIDLKIPSDERARIPVLTYENVPIWVCGLRIDERYKVTEDTETVLEVSFRWWDGNVPADFCNAARRSPAKRLRMQNKGIPLP
jgi:tRNA(Ile)-lysidine synthase